MKSVSDFIYICEDINTKDYGTEDTVFTAGGFD